MAEKKIGGKTYKVEGVLATQALTLQARLLRTFSGTFDRLPAILAGMGSKATEAEQQRSNAELMAAVTSVFGERDPEEITALIGDIAKMAMIKRPSGAWEEVDLDADFTGNLADLIPVVGFVLQEVLGDFFGAVLASGGRVKAKGGN